MAVDERSRHRLYEKLIDVIGDESTSTLMGYLPPVGWADVATKQDFEPVYRRFEEIDRRFDALDRRLERIEGRIDGFQRDLVKLTRVFIFATVASNATIASLAFAAARLV